MTSRQGWCRGFLLLSQAAVLACSDGPMWEAPEWPFDPSGIWVAEVTGRSGGVEVTSELTLTLVDDRERCGACLEGTWAWAGWSGPLEVHWQFDGDQFVDRPGCYSEPILSCTVGMILSPPDPTACSQPFDGIEGRGYEEVRLRGMFESETSFIATQLEGAYWEGAPGPWPCPGPEQVSFDTEVVLTKQ